MNRIITDWNNNKQDYPRNINLSGLIELQTSFNPHKVACYFSNSTLTFSDLNAKANQLAHFIKTRIQGNSNYILLHMDRTIESVIAILAILKSGNIYIPIDINASPPFIQQVISDCDVKAIISSGHIAEKINNTENNLCLINLTENHNEIRRMPLDNLDLTSKCEIAYVLYTSGTTGLPKGVKISQNSLINLLFAMQKEINFSEKECVLALTPLTFDISGLEIYLPLVFGASFVFADTETRYDPKKIINSIEKYNITIMQATPVTWQMLVNANWTNPNKIKMLCGGEGLSSVLASQLIKTQGPLWNCYGPTETTIWSTIYKVSKIDKNKPLVALGKPIANTHVYVLDKNLHQVALGEYGELYIGGDGVAIEYINNQELTNSRFINYDLAKTKVYKTGDIVYLDKSKLLHFVGRVDSQVKIRGHRIEIGAIESAINEHPAIKECVVLPEKEDFSKILVAFVTLNYEDVSLEEINTFIRTHIDTPILPSKYIVLHDFPISAHGKIDRNKINNHPKLRELVTTVNNTEQTENTLERIISDIISKHIKKHNISPTSRFQDIGLHSLGLVDLTNAINSLLNLSISVIDLINYPTIRSFAKFLLKTQNANLKQQYKETKEYLKKVQMDRCFENDIAIIGMACKFPHANNYNDFWNLILNKKNTISFFKEEELFNSGVTQNLINDEKYVPARGILDDVDKFDAGFFNISPAEARLMDPQQRVLLEQSWAALEDAGYVPDKFPGKISVFAGMNDSTYLQSQILLNPHLLKELDPQQIMLGTSPHYLATKISYKLGLSGPSITIGTACSTGLVAVNMAVENLREYKSDMAIAAAVNITVPQQSGYLYRELGIFSPDGACNVFANNAQGTVLSNGVGVVILKRLNEAVRDNDNIIAIIKGSAINNDGDVKSAFTAPSIDPQANCIKSALKNANIEASEVEFVEAHGTGTIVGDPIEVAALTKGYKSHLKKGNYCALGSVKSNIGHTDTASGIAGLIKASLALYHKTLPANINYTTSNQQIDFSKTPFFVNTENSNWITQNKYRFAGVNSLGFGGTNAHLILQEPPNPIKTTKSKSANILLISAKVRTSLNQSIANIKEYLINNIGENSAADKLADCAYTLQIGRKHFSERFAVTFTNYKELVEVLNSSKNTAKHISSVADNQNRKIIFGFVGQGPQYPRMAYDLYMEHPYFKEIVDRCCSLIKKETGFDFKSIIFPNSSNIQQANMALAKTEYAQPSLFIIEYALAKFLISLGIIPDGMIGHSLGEYVAATISGVFNLKDAIKLIIARSKLMAKTKPGVMLAIPLSTNEILPYLNEDVDIAAQNAPNLCVISGSKKSIANFIEKIKHILSTKDLNYQYLHTSRAFHSQYMDPILDEFLNAIKDVKFNNPQIPFISNISGNWITAEDIKSPRYWATHMRNSVLFADGIESLNLKNNDIFIEIGPGSTLSQIISQHIGKNPQILGTLPHFTKANTNSYAAFLNTISKLWLLDNEINWEILYKNESRRRVKLPTYAFIKQSHWIHPTISNTTQILDNGLFTPSWQRHGEISFNQPEYPDSDDTTWIIFDRYKDLYNYLKSRKQNVYHISLGDGFAQTDKFSYIINPKIKKHFVNLLNSINFSSKTLKVIHCSLTGTNLSTTDVLYHGPFCILYLAQAFSEVFINKDMDVLIVSQNLYNVLGKENIIPSKASILGPCKVIPQEHHNIKIKLIDVEEEHLKSVNIWPALANEIENISATNYKDEIAYRGNFRWIQKLQIDKGQLSNQQRLKLGGTYLITGGLGGIGLTIAEFLAKEYNASIILISRTSTIDATEWQTYISDEANTNNPEYKKIKKLLSIKSHAKNLDIFNASIIDKEELSKTIDLIKQKYININGVIHAAGLPGMGVYELKTVEEYNKILEPKLYGTEYLFELFSHENLDFFALFSSTIAITGFPGQIDYCSANRILDAYMEKSSAIFEADVFCVTINWQAWRMIGMAAESETILINLNETNSINPQDGCEIFRKIINGNSKQVVVSNTDLSYYDHQKLNLIPPVKFVNLEQLDNDGKNTFTINILLDIWKNILGLSKISIDDDFYDLGGNSLLAISLIAKIRSRFTINIPSTILFKERTIRSIANIIEKNKNQIQHASPLVQLNKINSTTPPVFFFHPIGGTVFCYLELAKGLKLNRAIYAFSDPSIECKKNIFKNIEEQAAFYRTIIQKVQKEGPYYLCGSSYGASLVMELAYQLEKSRETVDFVGLIDGWGYIEPREYNNEYIKELINALGSQNDLLLNHTKHDFFEKLVSERLHMLEKHIHKRINTPIYLFKAINILPEYQNINCEDNHWSNYSSYPVNIYNIPGNHNTMLEKGNAAYLAEKICECISKIEQRESYESLA